MTDEQSDEFCARLETLAELFDKKLSPAVQALYFAALEDLDYTAITWALDEASRTCKFFPRPAELRELVQGGGDLGAEAAWMEYKRLARSAGGYVSPEMPAALADTLVAVFGSWENACWIDLSPEMWASKRKEFDRVYRVIVNRGATGRRLLEGFFERDNRLKGFSLPVNNSLAKREEL